MRAKYIIVYGHFRNHLILTRRFSFLVPYSSHCARRWWRNSASLSAVEPRNGRTSSERVPSVRPRIPRAWSRPTALYNCVNSDGHPCLACGNIGRRHRYPTCTHAILGARHHHCPTSPTIAALVYTVTTYTNDRHCPHPHLDHHWSHSID